LDAVLYFFASTVACDVVFNILKKFLRDAYADADVGVAVGVRATSFFFFPVTSSLQN